jgi:hypothetical protein
MTIVPTNVGTRNLYALGFVGVVVVAIQHPLSTLISSRDIKRPRDGFEGAHKKLLHQTKEKAKKKQTPSRGFEGVFLVLRRERSKREI